MPHIPVNMGDKNRHHDSHPRLIEFCEKCPFDDCTAMNGCAEFKKLSKAIRDGTEYQPPEGWGMRDDYPEPERTPDSQALLDEAFSKLEQEKLKKAKSKPKPKPKPPAIELEELPANPVQNTQLHKYNEAIRALEELQPYAISMDREIAGMLGVLKGDRAAKFDHLVDWDAIARGGNK